MGRRIGRKAVLLRFRYDVIKKIKRKKKEKILRGLSYH